MALAEAVIAAGLGCKRGVSCGQVLAAFLRALHEVGRDVREVRALFAPAHKHDEAGLVEAAARLGLPLTFIELDVLAVEAPQNLTHSLHSLAHTGVPSAAESCALAGLALLTGTSGTLCAPRLALDGVTCALAKPT